MNKNGFTIIELLGVIAILGILLLIAVPSVENVVEISEKNIFLSESQNVYRMAKLKAVDLVNTSNDFLISSNGVNELDLDGNPLDYCVIIDEEAEITSIIVSNGKYVIRGDSDFLSLDSDAIYSGNMNNYICE